MKICIFGKRVSLLFYEKELISVKREKKKKKEKTYHIKKTQPSAYKHMHSQICAYSEAPAPKCIPLHTHADGNADTQTHVRSLYTSPVQPPHWCRLMPRTSQPNFRHVCLGGVSPAFPKH